MVPTLMLRQAIFECQRQHTDKVDAATPKDLEKISAHVFGSQPSYVDMFQYASVQLSGGIVALVNADIVLRNIERLHYRSLQAQVGTPLVIVLSISPPTGKYSRQCTSVSGESRCQFWDADYGLSWDAFIFASPLVPSANYSFLDPPSGKLPIYMNTINAENCAGNFLVSSGYTLANPCRSVIAEHWHCMGSKTHHRGGRDRQWARECALRGAYGGSGSIIRITKTLTLGRVGGPGTLC